MLWCQGMWCLSRANQLIKLQQLMLRNPESCKIRSQSSQDHQRHNSSSRRLHNQNIQIQKIQKNQKSQNRSTLIFYWNPQLRRMNLKSQQSVEQSYQLNGHRRDRTKASLPLRNSQMKTLIKHHEYAWQSWQETWIPMTRMNQPRSRKPSIIPHVGSSGR